MDMNGERATDGVTDEPDDDPRNLRTGIAEPDRRLERDEGVTADERAALERVRTFGWLLDDAVPVPGTDYRVGLDPVLGILPVAGDAIAALLSLYPVVEAYRLGVERRSLARMLALVAVDAGVGSVPVLGTLFDAFWTANEWNVRTIERHVERG